MIFKMFKKEDKYLQIWEELLDILYMEVADNMNLEKSSLVNLKALGEYEAYRNIIDIMELLEKEKQECLESITEPQSSIHSIKTRKTIKKRLKQIENT